MQGNSNILSLSIRDTSIMKGIAILAMLFHHTYAWIPSDVESYDGILGYLGILGKVCVSLFLFCSGYGMSSRYMQLPKVDKLRETFSFLVKRLIKFYTGYWLVFVIFVPLSVILFQRSLTIAYYGDGNIMKCLLMDILGLQGYNSYNQVWWFNRIILILYILFPILYYTCIKYPLISLLIGALLSLFSNKIPFNVSDIYLWQFPFLVGILYQQNVERFTTFANWLYSHKRIFASLTILVLIFTIYIRPYIGLQIDALLALEFALFTIAIIRNFNHVSKVLIFLGKYSFNMYMIHAFIIYYWFPHWFHVNNMMRNGGNIFILLFVSLTVSILLELIKEKAGINTLVKQKILDRI